VQTRAGGSHGGEGRWARSAISRSAEGATIMRLLQTSLENGRAETRRQLRSDGAAHAGRTGGADDRHIGLSTKARPPRARPRRSAQKRPPCIAETRDGALEDLADGEAPRSGVLSRDFQIHGIAPDRAKRRIQGEGGDG